MRSTINILATLLMAIALGCSGTGKQGFYYNFPPEIASQCWGAYNDAVACVERVTGRTITEQGRSLTVYKQAGERMINGRWAWHHKFPDGRTIEVSGLNDEPRGGEYAVIIGVDPATGKLAPNSTVDLKHEFGGIIMRWLGYQDKHPSEFRDCFNNWNDPR